ncbi:MAG: filamentous hemagglutinin N-terminal domain-containing protein, partial [Rickettsiales bacterium]|nr:filamentous hemagglutinin N-terminal domain-containing protein [Rickettsiales bacterium]
MADFIFNSKRGFKVKGIGGIFLNDRNRESSENKEFLRRKTIKGEKFPRDGKTPRGSEFLGSEEIVKNKELMSINDKEFLGNKWSFNFLKKLTALFLSFTIIYSQFFFTILLSQITINSIIKITSDSDNPYQLSLLTSEAHASSLDSNIPHSIQNPMNNIVDNPIPYIEIDNSIGKGETGLDRSQNGTPIIHINNPNDSGISANYYKDFNVTNENLIFNNHQGEAVSTNLGGVIYGNPNFKNPNGKEADIILNEITANRQTKIEGYMEIAGKKADLIIANPNGIMVSGGGFLNTSRLALITGSSLNGNNCDPSTNPSSCSSFDLNNNLNPFQLSTNPNATITIVGRNITDNQGRSVAYNLGIDASNQDYLALISRVVQINGDIIGNLNTNLEIKTGNNKASYNKDIKEFEVDSDDSKEQLKPEFAI